MGFKLSNVLGAPFQDYVTTQIATRAVKNSVADRSRTLEEVLFIGNKTAWVKLQSSVNITGSVSDKNPDTDYYALLKQQDNEQEGWFQSTWDSADTDHASKLASQWVLQAGTSKAVSNRYAAAAAAAAGTAFEGPNMLTELRSGIGYDNAYGLGGIKAQGYRPMPGLESVNIETKGKLGSLRYATINFKVWNMNQLDVIDALYFRLGFTMLLEWGHTQYFTDVDSNQLQVDDPSNTGIDIFYKSDVTKDQIHEAINKKIFETKGNYDGMLGVVTNFNYSMNQDGGWDCSIKLIGLGSLLETQKITSNYKMPPGVASYYDRLAAQIVDNQRQKDYDAKILLYQKELLDEAKAAIGRSAAFEEKNPIKSIDDIYNGKAGTPPALGSRPSAVAKDTRFIWSPNAGSTVTIVGDYTQTNQQLVENAAFKADETKSGIHKGEFYLPKITPQPRGFINSLKIGSRVYIPLGYLDNFGDNSVVTFINQKVVATINIPLVDFVNERNFARGILKGDNSGADGYSGAAGLFSLGLDTKYSVKLENLGGTTVGIKIGDLKLQKPVDDISLGIEIIGGGGRFVTRDRRPDEGVATVTIDYIKTAPGDITIKNIYDTHLSIYEILDSSNDNLDDFSITKEDLTRIRKSISDAMSIRTGFREDLAFEITKVTDSGTPGGVVSFEAIQGTDITGKNDTEKRSFFKVPGTFNLLKGGIPFPFTDLKVRIKIISNAVGLISDIINLGVDQAVTGAKPIQAPKKQTGDFTEEELSQVTKSGGLESALEAMLTIVQFEALLGQKNSPNITSFPTISSTGRILVETPNTLFSGLFLAGLPTSSKPPPYSLNKDFITKQLSKKETPNRATDPISLGLKGFNTSLMSGQIVAGDSDKSFDKCFPNTVEDDQGNITKTDVDQAEIMFTDLMTSWCVPYIISNSASDNSLATTLHKPVYIKLGYLLFFINNFCLLYDTTKATNKNGGKVAKPFFYVDFNTETNFCFSMPHQLSVDPMVCLVPYKGGLEGYKKIFTTLTEESLKTTFDGVINKETDRKLFDPATNDVVSPKILGYESGDDNRGRTMNILLNVRHLLDLLKTATQSDGHSGVYLKPFLDAVLRDVNKVLGDMNALRVTYSDPSNTVCIIDDQYVTPLKGEANVIKDAGALVQDKNSLISGQGNIIMPVYGRASLVRDFELSTNITTKMSSMIAIGATSGKASAQGIDGSGFRALSRGLIDRVITERSEVDNTPAVVKKTIKDNNNESLPIKFNQHIKRIYGIGKIDSDYIASAQNYLITNSANLKAGNLYTNANPTIPLNVSFTMDGIAGIMMGNSFLLPNEIMPLSVRGNGALTRFGFVVIRLDHSLQNNQWLTTIGGQMIRLKDQQHTNIGDIIGNGLNTLRYPVITGEDNLDINRGSGGLTLPVLTGTAADDFLPKAKDGSGAISPFTNFALAAENSINTSTGDINNTNNGKLGCGAGASIIFLRATGHGMKKGAKEPGKNVFLLLGTGEIQAYLSSDTSNWKARDDWKDAQPGDCLVTVTIKPPPHGHIGFVANTLDTDGSYDVISNSTRKKAIMSYYSIKKWSEIATRKGVGRTYAYEFIGTFGLTI